MDNQENKQPAGGEGASRKPNHNHKKHKGHRHGPRPDGAKPAGNGEPRAQKQENGGERKKPDNNNQKGGNRNNGGANPNQNNKGHDGNHKGKQNDRRNDQKKRRQSPNRGPENLYGNPTENDVLTMEELRAKIVLKAADGSVPIVENQTKTVAEPAAEEVDAATVDALLSPDHENPPEADETVERVEVVGIRFRSAGKVYYFDPKGNKLLKGAFAIVETARGPEFGEVSFGNRMIKKSGTVSPLRPVLRAATDEDIAHNRENEEKEKQAFTICQKKIAEHKLDMKLIDAQYAFDNSKLLFYFSSEGRVDFRDLVKDLASVFRTRIELRQIGIRDEAKMLGGLGSCGRPLCCASFLPDFMQVSIKMAKEQGLSLNSAKISGLCGRLMCCLRYESEVYAEELRRLPRHDATVKTPEGIGTVANVAPMTGMIKVVLKKDNETVVKQFHKDEITVMEKPRGENRQGAKSAARDGNESQAEEKIEPPEAPEQEPTPSNVEEAQAPQNETEASENQD